MSVRRLSALAALRGESFTAAIKGHAPVPPLIPTCAPSRLIPPPPVFTRAEIERVRSTLLPAPTMPLTTLPPHTERLKADREPRDAAVLIPLCNIGGVASLLMEVRAAAMRVHASEASFPGGKCDETDRTIVESALRETHEELAVPPSHVEILGGLPPEYSLGNRSRVWPVVGFVHASIPTSEPISGDKPLDSISLSSLVPEPGEVAALLPLPLSAIADPTRQVPHYFRLNGRWPYWKIRATDFVMPPSDAEPSEYDKLEIWGLSGWFLSRLATRCGWSDVPQISLPPDAEHDSR